MKVESVSTLDRWKGDAADLAKHVLVRTPFESAAEALRRRWVYAFGSRDRRRAERLADDLRIREVLRRLLSDEANCVDVGAHVGLKLSWMLKLAPNGKHVAFEPTPRKARRLARKFPEVRVESVALCDRDGYAPFMVDPAQSANNRLLVDGCGSHDAHELMVECRKLDSVLPPDHRVDLIKLDVEGAEYRVLRGATRVLAESAPAIVFECLQRALEANETTAGDVYELLADELGYEVFSLEQWLRGEGALSAPGFVTGIRQKRFGDNFLALAKRRKRNS